MKVGGKNVFFIENHKDKNILQFLMKKHMRMIMPVKFFVVFMKAVFFCKNDKDGKDTLIIFLKTKNT